MEGKLPGTEWMVEDRRTSPITVRAESGLKPEHWPYRINAPAPPFALGRCVAVIPACEDALALATLFASAPSMLEALQAFPQPSNDEPPDFFAVRCLRWMNKHRGPAIAKATGVKP